MIVEAADVMRLRLYQWALYQAPTSMTVAQLRTLNDLVLRTQTGALQGDPYN